MLSAKKGGLLYLATMFVALFAIQVVNANNGDLSSYQTQVYTAPAESYKAVNEQLTVNTISQDEQIWLLLRRAQLENVLTLYPAMTDTLDALAALSEQMTLHQRTLLAYLNGSAAHKAGQLNKSLNWLTEAIELSKGFEYMATEHVLATGEKGYVHALSGDFYQANAVLYNAYTQLTKDNNPFFVALIEEALGDTFSYSGNYENALKHYDNALSSFESLDYKPFIASTLLGLAIVHRRLENWEKALALFDKYQASLAFAKGYSENYYLHYARAMTLAEMGNCEQAVPAIDTALELNGVIDYHAELHKQRAKCHLKSNNISAAEIDLAAAKHILDNMEDLHGTQWYLELEYIAGLIAFEKKDYQRAFELLHQHHLATEKLNAKNNSEQIISMQASLEAERKDKEIAILKQQTELKVAEMHAKSLKVRQQQILLIAVVVTVLILLAFIIMQFRYSRKLLALSVRDELTGLHNRRYFFDYFATGVSKNTSLSLIVFDIDDFKTINDSWGHQIGDQVITEVAQAALAVLREFDLICRIGGDEFYVVLPRTDPAQAEEIAERLVANMAAKQFSPKEQLQINLTLSLGIAHFDKSSNTNFDIDRLIEAADKALYESKKRGKNCLTVASEIDL